MLSGISLLLKFKLKVQVIFPGLRSILMNTFYLKLKPEPCRNRLPFLNLAVFQTLDIYAQYTDFPECIWKDNSWWYGKFCFEMLLRFSLITTKCTGDPGFRVTSCFAEGLQSCCREAGESLSWAFHPTQQWKGSQGAVLCFQQALGCGIPAPLGSWLV